jgi:hypothetical protein
MTPTLTQSTEIAEAIKTRFAILAGKNVDRLASAAQIASTPGAITGDAANGYNVKSQNRDKVYHVSLAAHACTCPDHLAHAAEGAVCKHRLACYILQRFNEQPAAQAQPEEPKEPEFWPGQEWTMRRREFVHRDKSQPEAWHVEIKDITPHGAKKPTSIYVDLTSPDGQFRQMCLDVAAFLNNPYYKAIPA